jgi:hypothetical protein
MGTLQEVIRSLQVIVDAFGRRPRFQLEILLRKLPEFVTARGLLPQPHVQRSRICWNID